MLVSFKMVSCNFNCQGEDEIEGRPSSEEDSSDDDREWVKEVKQQHKYVEIKSNLVSIVVFTPHVPVICLV